MTRFTLCIALGLLTAGCRSAQVHPAIPDYASRARELSSLHELHRVDAIATRTFKPADYWETVGPLTGTNIRRDEIGKSAHGRPIYLLTYGSGPTKILLWSQMHGDESTASMTLADFARYLNSSDDRARAWAQRVTVYMVPVLNPDGAERFQRENALGIDINRDARMQATPEGRALKTVRDRIQPHFGFNLHDQNVRTRVGNTDRLAAIALLAPPPDASGTITDVRRRAMHVAAVIRNSIEPLVAGHVTKYDESFNPRAFGDLMQQWGTSTVLIESGGWRNDPEKQHLRKTNFVALVSAIDAIANDTYRQSDVADYTSLPSNGRAVRDLVIRGATVIIPGLPPYRADVAVDQQTSFEGVREGRVVEIGDLAEVMARDTVDANGMYLHAAPGALTTAGGTYLRIGAPAQFDIRAGAEAQAPRIMRIDGIDVEVVQSDPDSARIVTSDVANFWRAFDKLTPGMTRADSARVFEEEYLRRGSPGLGAYVESRLKKPENLLMALGMLPKYMAAVRAHTLSLRQQEPLIRESLRKLKAFYPDATFPDIYFVIAGFISQGTISDGKILLAAEMVSADAATPMHELPPFLRDVNLSRAALPCILVHEVVHTLQNNKSERTLLAQSLGEGVADFITQKAIGCIPTAAATYAYGEANETALWQEFEKAMLGSDYSKWLYNGNDSKDRPSQLGYWMGYQIAEAYYNSAKDKQQAVRDLLHITDYKALLEKSGYR